MPSQARYIAPNGAGIGGCVHIEPVVGAPMFFPQGTHWWCDVLKNLAAKDFQDICRLAAKKDAADKRDPDRGKPLVIPSERADELMEEILHGPPPKERMRLTKRIEKLSADAQAELVAIMMVGRGDCGASRKEFDAAVQHGRVLQHVPDYLAGKVGIGRYLEKGARAVGLD
jgi:hypothetical protein